jgi:hypothetical protein
MSYRQKQNGPVFVASSGGSNLAELIKDFLVDGLGILLPGLGFLFACIPAVMAPLVWLAFVVDARVSGTSAENIHLFALFNSPASDSLGKVLSSFHVEIFLALVGISYIVGHLLFRQDIKEPDKKSFLRSHCPSQSMMKGLWRWLVRLCGSEARFPIYWNDKPSSASPDNRKFWNVLRPEIPIVIQKDIEGTGWTIQKGRKLDGMVRPVETDVDLSEVSVEYPYHFICPSVAFLICPELFLGKEKMANTFGTAASTL